MTAETLSCHFYASNKSRIEMISVATWYEAGTCKGGVQDHRLGGEWCASEPSVHKWCRCKAGSCLFGDHTYPAC